MASEGRPLDPHRRPALAAVSLFVCLAVAIGAAAGFGDPVAAAEIPRDDRGLPMWEIAVYDDFPVGISLESREALTDLLERVPIAAFDREHVRLEPGPGSNDEPSVRLETRVTEAEAAALDAAGIEYEKLRDFQQEGRRAIEAEWMRQAEAGELRSAAKTLGTYHTYAQIGTMLAAAETDHPAIAERFSVGTSVQGRELWAIRITDNVGVEEAEPEVRLSGAIHGDENPGLEMLLYLVEWLTNEYGTNPDVTQLVDEYEIVILPCLNVDGLVAGTRRNARGVDLNRNFPVPDGSIGDDGTWTEEAETIAFQAWGDASHFVVSGNTHTGALVVNYPWDYTYTLAWDDAAIRLLSLEYSTYNLPMYNGSFPQGITNGADWYVVDGSLQDWSYKDTDCIDVTLELSNSFVPPASQLDGLWDDNRESLRHYILAAKYGLHGRVTNSVSGVPVDATITVAGIPKPVSTDPDFGDYYKLLPTGTHDLWVAADGYYGQWIYDVPTTWGTPTVLDIQLDSESTSVLAGADGDVARLTASPNPFRGRTVLRFSGGAGKVGDVATLAIYDVNGRLVRTLADGSPAAPTAAAAWDGRTDSGSTAANGVYFARFESGDVRVDRKVVLAR